MKLSELQRGDKVTRMLAGVVPMPLTITFVTDSRIVCGDWVFNRTTGLEVDADLGWDGVENSGSYIIPSP